MDAKCVSLEITWVIFDAKGVSLKISWVIFDAMGVSLGIRWVICDAKGVSLEINWVIFDAPKGMPGKDGKDGKDASNRKPISSKLQVALSDRATHMTMRNPHRVSQLMRAKANTAKGDDTMCYKHKGNTPTELEGFKDVF